MIKEEVKERIENLETEILKGKEQLQQMQMQLQQLSQQIISKSGGLIELQVMLRKMEGEKKKT